MQAQEECIASAGVTGAGREWWWWCTAVCSPACWRHRTSSGGSMPASMRMKVVLPVPDMPMTITHIFLLLLMASIIIDWNAMDCQCRLQNGKTVFSAATQGEYSDACCSGETQSQNQFSAIGKRRIHQNRYKGCTYRWTGQRYSHIIFITTVQCSLRRDLH